MGDSNRTALYFGEEVTWGTLATCTFQELRFTGESFAYNITNVTSSEIRSDRQIYGALHLAKAEPVFYSAAGRCPAHVYLSAGSLYAKIQRQIHRCGAAQGAGQEA